MAETAQAVVEATMRYFSVMVLLVVVLGIDLAQLMSLHKLLSWMDVVENGDVVETSETGIPMEHKFGQYEEDVVDFMIGNHLGETVYSVVSETPDSEGCWVLGLGEKFTAQHFEPAHEIKVCHVDLP